MSKAHRYTDDDKAAALDVLKSDGLTAAAKSAGCAKSTILRWATAAGLDPSDYSDRSTTQNEAAARASVAARRALMVEASGALSARLVSELAPKALDLLSGRLDEQARVSELIADDEERLEQALESLKIATQPDDPTDPRSPAEQAAIAKMAEDARQQVADAMLFLRAHRSARATIPELVGVLTRSVTDHLNLEGKAQAQPAAGAFTVIITSPRPDRSERRPDVVTLPSTAIEEHTP